MVPKVSICLSGLKLTRPRRQAVSSPSMRATNPCAASWKVIAMITGMTQADASKNVISNPCGNCGTGGAPAGDRLRPLWVHPVGGVEIFPGIGEERPIARMIDGLDRRNGFHQLGVMVVNV